MTEQAKMTSHEEKNNEGTGKERAGWSFFIIGIIVSLIGYVFYDFHINHYLITQTGRKIFSSLRISISIWWAF